MSAYRDWDVAVAEDAGEPVEFTLGGERFAVPTPLPAVSFVDLAARRRDGLLDPYTAQSQWLASVISGGEMDDRYQRVTDAMRASRIGLERLLELCGWIVEEVTARPTGRRDDSPASPPSNGDTSSNGSTSRDDASLLVAASASS